jgi:hypothetical protein
MAVYSSEGQFVGKVSCEVSDLEAYTHRYLIIEQDGRRLAVPSDTIDNISQDGITLTLQADALESLPPYDPDLGHAFELRVHFALNRTPYWEIDTYE